MRTTKPDWNSRSFKKKQKARSEPPKGQKVFHAWSVADALVRLKEDMLPPEIEIFKQHSSRRVRRAAQRRVGKTAPTPA